MQPDTQKQIEELSRKIDEIYVSVEKTRKYFLWTMIITLAVIILPLIVLAFVIPSFISSYTSAISNLGV